MGRIKLFVFIALSGVVGIAIGGFVMFYWMQKFGVDWNSWAASMDKQRDATAALARVRVLTSMRAGDVNRAESTLEWQLNTDAIVLIANKRGGQDLDGSTTKAIAAIKAYRSKYPWNSASPEFDKAVADVLNEPSAPATSL